MWVWLKACTFIAQHVFDNHAVHLTQSCTAVLWDLPDGAQGTITPSFHDFSRNNTQSYILVSLICPSVQLIHSETVCTHDFDVRVIIGGSFNCTQLQLRVPKSLRAVRSVCASGSTLHHARRRGIPSIGHCSAHE